MYAPLPSVTVLRTEPVSVCAAVTLTPGSTAPLSSVTLPLNCAVDSCANAMLLVRRRPIAATHNSPDGCFIYNLLLRLVNARNLLEPVLHAKLHDARRALHRRNPSERARAEVRVRSIGAKSQRGRPPVERVEQVERLHAELQLAGGANGDQPRDRHVDRPVPRPSQAVALEVPQRAERRLCERGRIEPVFRRLLVAIRIVE